MKTIFTLALLAFTFFVGKAQVTLELEQDQNQFLRAEPMPLAVKITNRSGQPIHLGADANWLTFNVESADGFVVIKNSEVPVQGAFDLESSQLGIKRVDLQPYFMMTQPGRYKITATMRIPDWSATTTSAPRFIDIVHGAKVWSQEFGVRDGTNAAPDVRKYTLRQANFRNSQMRLYVQLSDSEEARVYHTEALGAMVAFAQPEAQVDPTSQLHVLWQGGAQSFNYCVVSSAGKVVRRETYDNFSGRPHLAISGNGEVLVRGGNRRGAMTEMPVVKAPAATVADKK